MLCFPVLQLESEAFFIVMQRSFVANIILKNLTIKLSQ